jgi:mannose-1-phosphate guanylyltransferase
MTSVPWAVVLAGGDGDRVSAITRDAEGGAVPKQFWCRDGHAPMVRWALARARRIAPARQVLVVVKEAHRRHCQRHLADVPRESILVQPENRGTAAGVLRALVEIESRVSTAAPVVLLPSDHYVAEERVLHDALVVAVRAACEGDPPVVLLGISPSTPEHGYGWILPDAPGVVSRVRRFVEKPPVPHVTGMIRDGALINSFILVSRVHVLLALIERVYPDILHAFQRLAHDPADGPAARRLYEGLPFMDLSRDVLQRASRFLSVIRVPPCGWSDLGTPERLRQYLGGAPHDASFAPAPVGTAAA